jgi:predicted AAA+ superfamily ATPase
MAIQNPDQLNIHPFRGAIFESFVISEFFKSQFNMGLKPSYYYWRDRAGNEIDFLVEHGNKLRPFEIKSGKTINQHYFNDLKKWMALSGVSGIDPTLIYGGDQSLKQNEFNVVSWMNVGKE